MHEHCACTEIAAKSCQLVLNGGENRQLRTKPYICQIILSMTSGFFRQIVVWYDF